MDIFPGAMHSAGPSMIIPLDLSKNLRKPNILALGMQREAPHL